MESQLEERLDENDCEEEDTVIKDFDDVFDFIGGWGPFQVKLVKSYPEVKNILLSIINYKNHASTTLPPVFIAFLPVPYHPGLLPLQHLPRLCLPLPHTHLIYSSPLVTVTVYYVYVYLNPMLT